MKRMTPLAAILTIGLVGCAARQGTVVCSLPHESPALEAAALGAPDLSGETRVGKASFYARQFFRHRMANGQRMDPQGLNAASRTLPLGTTARVTNLTTGQSALIRIEDRGPYVNGRIVDLSPAIARRIGITRRIGVAPVKVAPIDVVMPDGTTRSGAGRLRPVCRAT